MSVKSILVKASVATAGTVLVAVGVLAPGIAADAESPLPADANARDLTSQAFKPDHTVGNFIDAALDGTGAKDRALETARGVGQDLYELQNLPGSLLVVATR
jgi:hypothetical protein